MTEDPIALNRINVTVVIKSLGLGGAERLLVDALPYLDRRRFDYRFAYVTPWKDTLAPHITAEGFALVCLGQTAPMGTAGPSPSPTYAPARSVQALTLLPAAMARLLAAIERTGCQLLQADLPAAGILARLAGKRAGIPVAYTEHNLQERYHPVTRWTNRVTYRWNDVVFAVSDEVAASIRRNGLVASTNDMRLRTLPNGVPVETIRAEATGVNCLRAELGIPQDRPVVGTVAVFRPQKRLLDWLAVARRVAETHDAVQFLLVGDGPEMPAVRNKVREYGLDHCVHITGFREDGRRLIGLMNVYLMTSAFEGMPIAMLEAMALARPVVATAVGGIPEVIESGRDGFLAQTGDVDLMAAQISALLRNPTAAAAMGIRGHEKVQIRFHTRNRVREMESTYLEMVRR